jgi:predicted hydrocarbon binding protein
MSEIIKVGEKEIKLSQYKNNWALALMSQGIIVKLSIARWRATAALKIEDLGLKFSDQESFHFMQRYVKLGTEKLLPPEILSEIETLETKARENLKTYSFDTVWGHFVPYKAFEKWDEENTKIKNDFMEAAKKIGERYDEIVQIVKGEYRKMGKDVWMRLYPNTPTPTEAFIEDYASKAAAKIIDRNSLVTSFKYDITHFIIPMPSIIEENISKIQEIKQERELSQLNNELEKETKRKISEEYVKRKQELIDNFLEATVMSMRKYIAELCDSVLQSIGRNSSQKDISVLHMRRIQNMIKKVNLLNFHNDTVITEILGELNDEINKFKGSRDKNIIITKLSQIVEMGEKEFVPEFNPSIDLLEV